MTTPYTDRVMPFSELQTIIGRERKDAVIRYLNKHYIDWRPDADGNPVVSCSAWNNREPVTMIKDNFSDVNWPVQQS